MSSTNENNKNDEILKPKNTNMGQLLMERHKAAAVAAANSKNKKIVDNHKSGLNNVIPGQQVASTPANIKRLQVNKWFNSPTDNLFSPCSKRLYNIKTHYQPIHLIDELESEEPKPKDNNDENKNNQMDNE